MSRYQSSSHAPIGNIVRLTLENYLYAQQGQILSASTTVTDLVCAELRQRQVYMVPVWQSSSCILVDGQLHSVEISKFQEDPVDSADLRHQVLKGFNSYFSGRRMPYKFINQPDYEPSFRNDQDCFAQCHLRGKPVMLKRALPMCGFEGAFNREEYIHYQLNVPSFLLCYGATRRSGHWYLVFSPVKSDLMTMLQQKPLSPKQLRRLIQTLKAGVLTLSQKKMYHQRLRSTSIFLDLEDQFKIGNLENVKGPEPISGSSVFSEAELIQSIVNLVQNIAVGRLNIETLEVLTSGTIGIEDALDRIFHQLIY